MGQGAASPGLDSELDGEAEDVTVWLLDDSVYITCLVAWVSNPGIIISIPQMYLDIPTEYRIDSLFD